MKPYMDEYSYILRTDGDNQAVVRFATSQEATKAMNELKETKISDEAAKKTSQKRENEVAEGEDKKVKTD